MSLDLGQAVKAAVKEAVREVLEELLARGGLGSGDGDQPLTYEQGAKYASCSEETICAWVASGLLPASGKGKLRRVTRAGIRLALERMATGFEPKKLEPKSRAAAIVRSIR